MSVKKYLVEKVWRESGSDGQSPVDLKSIVEEAVVDDSIQKYVMEKYGKSYIYLRGHIRDIMDSNDLIISTSKRQIFESELFTIVLRVLLEDPVALGFVGLSDTDTSERIFMYLDQEKLLE